MALLGLVLNSVIQLLILRSWYRLFLRHKNQELTITRIEANQFTLLNINSFATAPNITQAASLFCDVLPGSKNFVLNLSDMALIDARFIGLLLMLNKRLKREQRDLTLRGQSPRMAALFRLYGFGFLLAQSK